MGNLWSIEAFFYVQIHSFFFNSSSHPLLLRFSVIIFIIILSTRIIYAIMMKKKPGYIHSWYYYCYYYYLKRETSEVNCGAKERAIGTFVVGVRETKNPVFCFFFSFKKHFIILMLWFACLPAFNRNVSRIFYSHTLFLL